MNKVDIHKSICKELNGLYARKNADYGDSFGKSFGEYGLAMACIRLEDKLNRIKALSKQQAQVNDESIEDTLRDLANYSIMTLVELGAEQPAEEQGPACNSCRYRGTDADDYPCAECKHCYSDRYEAENWSQACGNRGEGR